MTRQAQFPTEGYQRPSTNAADSLVHTVYGESGELFGTFDFSDLEAPRQLVLELVFAFQKATGSSGRWRTQATVKAASAQLRMFVTALMVKFPEIESMKNFTPEMWWSWRADVKNRSRWPGQINLIRCLLYEVDGLTPTTRRALSGREKKPKNRLYESYSVGEFRRIYATAWKTVRDARRRIRSNSGCLKRYLAGNEHEDTTRLPVQKRGWSQGELLNHILKTGKFPGKGHIPNHWIDQFRLLLNLSGNASGAQAMFATTAEVFAGMVLLVCERGFNLSVLNGLVADPLNVDLEDGKGTVHALDKPRRGASARFFSTSMVGKAGRIWKAVAEITQPARDHLILQGKPTQLLLIGRNISGSSEMFKSDWTQCRSAAKAWQSLSDLRDDEGLPLVVDFRRLRLTEQVVNQRASQNSERVSESVYRRRDRQTLEMAREAILQGQEAALADAKAVVATRAINKTEIESAHRNPQALAAKLNVPVARVKQLINGECDTLVTACSDIFASPFSTAGDACTASFLRCFECKNSIATPKHLPRLALLHDALSELASTVSYAVWVEDYKATYDRLLSLLASYSTEAERVQARRCASPADVVAIGELLDRRYDA